MKQEKSAIRKVHELTKLAIAVNMHTDYCTFVRFAGHVNNVEISIRQSKSNYNKEIADCQFYLDRGEEIFNERYNEIKDVLVSILREGKVDYDMLDRHERIEYDYTF